MLFFYLQVEHDGDQHPAGGHDAVAGPEQWPPACVLDEQTLVDVVEEESNIQTRLIRCIRISVCCFPLHCLSSMSGIRNVYVANDFFSAKKLHLSNHATPRTAWNWFICFLLCNILCVCSLHNVIPLASKFPFSIFTDGRGSKFSRHFLSPKTAVTWNFKCL